MSALGSWGSAALEVPWLMIAGQAPLSVCVYVLLLNACDKTRQDFFSLLFPFSSRNQGR